MLTDFSVLIVVNRKYRTIIGEHLSSRFKTRETNSRNLSLNTLLVCNILFENLDVRKIINVRVSLIKPSKGLSVVNFFLCNFFTKIT